VADVGAGTGRDALELARVGGPTGHLFAAGNHRKSRDQNRTAAARTQAQNPPRGGGPEKETGRAVRCCDALLMRRGHHHVTRLVETNASLYQALRPGGRLAVVDFPAGWFLSTFFQVKGVPANRGGHGVPADVTIKELEAAGLILERRLDKWHGRSYC